MCLPAVARGEGKGEGVILILYNLLHKIESIPKKNGLLFFALHALRLTVYDQGFAQCKCSLGAD